MSAPYGSGQDRGNDSRQARAFDSHRPAKGDRVLFLAGALLLVTFAAIPLAYYGLGFLRHEGTVEPDPSVTFEEGFHLARTGRQPEATLVFLTMLEQPGRRDEGLTGLAYLRMLLGQRTEAQELCEMALRLNPRNRYALALRDLIREGADAAQVGLAMEELIREPSGSASTRGGVPEGRRGPVRVP